MAMPSFASPQLSDADITFSVRGYYSQYLSSIVWQRNLWLTSDGSTVTLPSSNNGFTSDFISVSPDSYFILTRISDRTIQNIRAYCFYDSTYNLISSTILTDFVQNYSSVKSFYIPSGVSFVKVSAINGIGYSFYTSIFPIDTSNLAPDHIFSVIDNISIDSDGNIFIPYQVYGFSQIYLDFKFFDSVYHFNNISFKVLSEYYDSTVPQFNGLLNYGDGQVLSEPYTLINGIKSTSLIFNTSSNPAHIMYNIPFNEFSGFNLYIPVYYPSGIVSSGIRIHLSDFMLDGEDVSARLEVDRLLSELDNLAQQLALPTPDLSSLLNVDDILNNQNDINASSIMSFIASDGGIITTMMIISVSLTVLGYILFGKKEA